MGSLIQFQDMTHSDKLDFFQRCQDLLIRTEPNSPYIIREGSERGKSFIIDAFLKYKGYVYEAEEVIIMFNKHFYEERGQAVEEYGQKLFNLPENPANTYSIDFIAARLNEHRLKEMEPYFNEDMKYIVFLRSQRPTIFEAENFKNAMKNKYFS